MITCMPQALTCVLSSSLMSLQADMYLCLLLASSWPTWPYYLQYAWLKLHARLRCPVHGMSAMARHQLALLLHADCAQNNS